MRAESGVFLAVGVFTVTCAVADFDWFMNNRRAWLFVKLFGRTGARAVYVLMGLGFIVGGFLLPAKTP